MIRDNCCGNPGRSIAREATDGRKSKPRQSCHYCTTKRSREEATSYSQRRKRTRLQLERRHQSARTQCTEALEEQDGKVKTSVQCKQRDPAKATRRSQPAQKVLAVTACKGCGGAPFLTRAHCPAKEAMCHKCNKKGHFSSCCFS